MKHKPVIKFIGIIISCIGFSAAMSQTTRPITLNEAIDLSIKNNKNLKVNRAKIEEAAAAVEGALNRRLPDATVSGSYLRIVNANVDLNTKNNSSGGTGGSTTGGGAPNPKQAVYGIANASLPLYAGYRIRYGIESAKYLAEAAKLDADNQKEEVIQNTIAAYANLYKAGLAVNIVRESLESSKQRVQQFSNLERNGLLARNDLLKAQLQTSNIELSLLDAESNRHLANVNMNLMLGLPESTTLQPDSIIQPEAITLKTIEEYELAAIQNRKDISALELRRKAANTNVKSIKAEAYPSIALTGGYIAAKIPDLLTVTNAINVGIGVQYNFASVWKGKAEIHQAEARERQVLINEDILNDAVRLQVNQAYENYLLSSKKIDVYNTAVTQAAENFRITKNKYENSLVTTTDLLDADVQQLQARLNLSNAKADAVVAYNKLLQTAGLLTK